CAKDLAIHLLGRALPYVPVVCDEASEATPCGGQRPGEFGFGKGPDGVHDLEMLPIRGGDGGVWRCFEEETDMTLIFDRRELLPGEQIERPGGDHDQHGRGNDAPSHLQRAVE